MTGSVVGIRAHTAGPWHRFKDEINNSDGLTVARFVEFVPQYRAESEANANLLAAAPDLLNACRAALPLVGSHPHTSSHTRFALLEDAIAKAEGRVKHADATP